jgi:ApeA N-terminal domain 1/Apea-like HEPN
LITSGRFWFEENPQLVVPGRLDLTGRRPRVELLGALLSFVVEELSGTPGVRKFVPAEPSGPRVIHGAIMGAHEKVTIVDAQQVQHRAKPFSALLASPEEGLQEQVFEGSYAILGMHVRGQDATFDAFRFRITRQDPWAFLSGLSMSIGDSHNLKIEYLEPETISVPLDRHGGRLTLEPTATFSQPRIAGAYVLTRTWLVVETANRTTIRDAWARFVTAASTLLTLLYDEDCPPTAFHVRDPESRRWCTVNIPGLGADTTDVLSSKPDEAALLSREQLRLERLAGWFDLSERLSPLPTLVAGAIQATDRTVQNLLLELATAAEGLHRRLHAGVHHLTERERADALAAIVSLDIETKAKERLRSAMATYLWELSFPQRLRVLAEDVAVATPGVTGHTKRWCDSIRDARNGFAHALAGDSVTAQKIYEYYTLQASLRWLLTGKLLLELGVRAEEVGQYFSRYDKYQRFLLNAVRDLPRVYAAT